MLGIKQAKMLLAQLGLTEEQTNEFENLITPHIEFHKFLMEKLDITSEEVEKMTESFSKTYIIEKIEEFKKNGGDVNSIGADYYFKIAGEAMKQVALNNAYDITKSDLLETNMIALSHMLMSVTLKLTNDDLIK